MAQSPQSSIEFAHNLRVPAMYEYMKITEVSSVTTPIRLIQLASNMAGHSHPLVRYAAGWAATEAGLVDRRQASLNKWKLKHREEALNLGNSIWHGIEDAEWRHAANPDDAYRQADLWGLSTRQRIAMAYLPALQLVARQRAAQPHTVPDTHEHFRRVSVGLLPIVRGLLKERNDQSERGSTMRGLAGELVVGRLLQPELLEPTPPREVEKPKHVVTPASLREDNHRRPADRADLNVYTLSTRSKKTSVQVGTTPKDGQVNPFQVVVGRDLGIDAQELLGQIYRQETGDGGKNPRLTEMSDKLLAGMAAYNQGRSSV